VISETATELDAFAAPYGREVKIEDIEHESGLRMLRIRIREGSRFTTMDIDKDTAIRWGTVMQTWVGEIGMKTES
jgi:hypothetical protein